MPRPTSRCHLESGLKLDLNRLARRGFIQPGAAIGPVGIRWTFNYTDEETLGTITADMRSADEGWFRIQIANSTNASSSLLVRAISAAGNGISFALT